jgi:AcrR family transcriptional regulator
MADRRLAPAARRTQLLDTAVRLAAGGDLLAVSVADIAEAARVSEGLLYHYFPSKQALLEAAVQRAADRLLADLTAAVDAPGPPMAQLAAALEAYLDHVQADPTGWRALLAATSGEPARIAESLDAATTALVCRALGIDEPGPALRLLLTAWSATERATCLAWLGSPELTRAAVRDLLLTAFGAALTSMAPHDPQVAQVLACLGEPPGGPAPTTP